MQRARENPGALRARHDRQRDLLEVVRARSLLTPRDGLWRRQAKAGHFDTRAALGGPVDERLRDQSLIRGLRRGGEMQQRNVVARRVMAVVMEPVVQDDAVDAQRVAALLDVVDPLGDREGFRRVPLDAMTCGEDPLSADDGAAAHHDLPVETRLDADEARPIGDCGGFAVDDAQIAAGAGPAGGRGAGRLRPSLRPLDNRSERGRVALVRRDRRRGGRQRERDEACRGAQDPPPASPWPAVQTKKFAHGRFPCKSRGLCRPRVIAWRGAVDLEASALRQTCRSSNPPYSC